MSNDTVRDFLLGPTVNARPLHAIAAEVCAKYSARSVDFFSRRRFRSVAWARQEYCYRARHETTASYPEIARLLGWDHSSAMYAVRRHEERMKKEAAHGT